MTYSTTLSNFLATSITKMNKRILTNPKTVSSNFNNLSAPDFKKTHVLMPTRKTNPIARTMLIGTNIPFHFQLIYSPILNNINICVNSASPPKIILVGIAHLDAVPLLIINTFTRKLKYRFLNTYHKSVLRNPNPMKK